MSPARPGAFNANFAPETLEAFKALCRKQGKQYTKVLEQFAEIYLKSEGAVLEQMSVPSSMETVGSSRHHGGASSSITTRGIISSIPPDLAHAQYPARIIHMGRTPGIYVQ